MKSDDTMVHNTAKTYGNSHLGHSSNILENVMLGYPDASVLDEIAKNVALLAHGIGEGDEVITTPFTFMATSNSVLFTGARPVFADIDDNTFNINPDAIMEIAEDYDLAVIEDACQAHGAVYDGGNVGSFGTGTFSFYLQRT